MSCALLPKVDEDLVKIGKRKWSPRPEGNKSPFWPKFWGMTGVEDFKYLRIFTRPRTLRCVKLESYSRRSPNTQNSPRPFCREWKDVCKFFSSRSRGPLQIGLTRSLRHQTGHARAAAKNSPPPARWYARAGVTRPAERGGGARAGWRGLYTLFLCRQNSSRDSCAWHACSCH